MCIVGEAQEAPQLWGYVSVRGEGIVLFIRVGMGKCLCTGSASVCMRETCDVRDTTSSPSMETGRGHSNTLDERARLLPHVHTNDGVGIAGIAPLSCALHSMRCVYECVCGYERDAVLSWRTQLIITHTLSFFLPFFSLNM